MTTKAKFRLAVILNFNFKVYLSNSRSTCNPEKKKVQNRRRSKNNMINVGDWFVKYAYFFQIRNTIYRLVL